MIRAVGEIQVCRAWGQARQDQPASSLMPFKCAVATVNLPTCLVEGH